MNIAEMVKIGRYAYARELSNGEWSIYVGQWSDRGVGHITRLEVCRDAGRPLRFTSLELAKEYAEFRAL